MKIGNSESKGEITLQEEVMKSKYQQLVDYVQENRREVKIENLNATQGFTFDDDKLIQIRRKIEESGETLGNICEVFCGTSKTGFRSYVKPLGNKTYTDKEFLESREIAKYYGRVEKVIDPIIYSTNVEHILSGKAGKEYIFVTRMTSSIRAFKPEKGIYCGKVNCVYPKESFDMGLIVSLLNTDIVTKYIYIISNIMHGGYISGDIPTLLKVIVPQGIDRLKGYTDKIQKLKRDGKSTEHLELEVAQIVQELYGLTDEEVEYLYR